MRTNRRLTLTVSSFVVFMVSVMVTSLWLGRNEDPLVTHHTGEAEAVVAETAELASARVLEETWPAMIDVAPSVTEDAQMPTTLTGAESLPQTEQQSLMSAFSNARRAIRPLTDHQKTMPENEGALYLASNLGQKIRARFLEDGVRLLSGYAGREWNAVLSLSTEGDVLEVRQQGTRLEYVRDGLIEWYHNKPEGLEHGFIVQHKTPELMHNGQLRIPLRIEGLVVETLDDGDLQFINGAGESVLSYNKLQVWDANGIELASMMNPTESGMNIIVADTGATYPITIDPLITSLETKLGPEVTGSGTPWDQFGFSVSVSGDTALIGAYLDDDAGSNSGSAYIFMRTESVWTQQAKCCRPN